MKTLFIDTHYLDIIIALIENGNVVRHEEVINKRNNSEYIFPTIVKVLGDESIDEVVVVNGPGSFTGVRLGVTIAKTRAYTLKISLKKIESVKIVEISTNAKKVALGDSNGYYIGCFDNNHQAITDYYYLSNNDFEKLEDKDEYTKDYILDIEKVIDYLKNKESINPHSAKPIYVKKIGVEIDKASK